MQYGHGLTLADKPGDCYWDAQSLAMLGIDGYEADNSAGANAPLPSLNAT